MSAEFFAVIWDTHYKTITGGWLGRSNEVIRECRGDLCRPSAYCQVLQPEPWAFSACTGTTVLQKLLAVPGKTLDTA
jgi:hypothetical protein